MMATVARLALERLVSLLVVRPSVELTLEPVARQLSRLQPAAIRVIRPCYTSRIAPLPADPSWSTLAR